MEKAERDARNAKAMKLLGYISIGIFVWMCIGLILTFFYSENVVDYFRDQWKRLCWAILMLGIGSGYFRMAKSREGGR